MKSVSIKDYDNSWYRPGGAVKRLLWYFVNVLFSQSIQSVLGYKGAAAKVVRGTGRSGGEH